MGGEDRRAGDHFALTPPKHAGGGYQTQPLNAPNWPSRTQPRSTGTRWGWWLAGSSFCSALDPDYSAGVALDALDVHSIPRGGTAIGQAITTAREAFATGAGGEKILILITDGENHEGDPVAAAKEAREAGITIYTIGLGSPAGELIMVKDEQGNLSYLRDNEGRVVKTVLNEGILQEIAEAGGGAYLHGRGASLGLDTLYRNELAKHKGTELLSTLEKKYTNRYQFPLFLALLLLAVEVLLDYRAMRMHG